MGFMVLPFTAATVIVARQTSITQQISRANAAIIVGSWTAQIHSRLGPHLLRASQYRLLRDRSFKRMECGHGRPNITTAVWNDCLDSP
jgi:hypothetical protein